MAKMMSQGALGVRMSTRLAELLDRQMDEVRVAVRSKEQDTGWVVGCYVEIDGQPPEGHDIAIIETLLKDLHWWVAERPGAKVMSADQGGLLGWTAWLAPSCPADNEQHLTVTIAVHDAKSSLYELPDVPLKQNLYHLLVTPGKRQRLCEFLATREGWQHLTEGSAQTTDQLAHMVSPKGARPQARCKA